MALKTDWSDPSLYYARVREAAEFLRARIDTVPPVAIVLGSGLGDFIDRLGPPATRVLYDDIPNWPAARVVGHAGVLGVGTIGDATVAALAGRAHFYEGHDLRTATFAVRALGVLGVRVLILTNAAGGLDPAFGEGALMVIDDHINLFGTNPLIGPHDERFGPRFPDMTEAYSTRLRGVADEVASALGMRLPHGVYAGLHGPSYETPAEIRFLRTIGADAVGMSTVPETIVARQMGMEVLGISCITNMAAGVTGRPLNHQEVMDTAQRVKGQFTALLDGVVTRLHEGSAA